MSKLSCIAHGIVPLAAGHDHNLQVLSGHDYDLVWPGVVRAGSGHPRVRLKLSYPPGIYASKKAVAAFGPPQLLQRGAGPACHDGSTQTREGRERRLGGAGRKDLQVEVQDTLGFLQATQN